MCRGNAVDAECESGDRRDPGELVLLEGQDDARLKV